MGPRVQSTFCNIDLRLQVDWDGDEFTPPRRTGGVEFGTHFEQVPRVGPWASDAPCRLIRRDFFPRRGKKPTAALALCNSCAVLEECRAYGLAHPSLIGIFGGLTEEERRRMRVAAAHARDALTASTETRKLFDVLLGLTRYPLKTWATIAASRDYPTIDHLAHDLRLGHHPLPPGTWEFDPEPNRSGGHLWARLIERDFCRPQSTKSLAVGQHSKQHSKQ